ncbi:MAG: VWA domain-containing protein [Candidatus Electrothrix sp. AR3]|nr:VWA domain-containing protein [Candidatus Electrothrix sp. AR3]
MNIRFLHNKKGVLYVGLFLLTLSLPINLLADADDLHLQISFDNGLVDVAQPTERHLEILVTAPETRAASKRLPLNIALVIDSSGSMNGSKIAYVKQAAEHMVNRLRQGDRFSLITYSDRARVLIASERIENLSTAHALIENIRSGGGTNMGEGLLAGYQEVQKYTSSKTINRIMLLSDGHANQGLTSPVRLGHLVQEEADNGIALSTFGVGSGFNEDLMASLSENGRGMYYFIDNPEQISSILAQEFRLTEQVVATGIRIELELHAGITLNKVYANKYDRQNNKLIIHGGDLSVGERRRYQIRLQPPALSPGSYRVGKVHLAYTPVGRSQAVLAEQQLNLAYQENSTGIDTHKDQGVAERSSVFLARYARDDAAQAVDKGDMQQAQQILAQAQQHLQGKTAQSSKLRQEQQALDKYAAALKTNMDQNKKARLQKATKYHKHALEGC